jgi:hypothetical protein
MIMLDDREYDLLKLEAECAIRLVGRDARRSHSAQIA